ncbi:Laminin subunit alpha-1-like [Phytophthora cinnamomi]|uniref:Laminin subunit alpha-1-like n=1 Tax=Phytophthora cinnamomi TaxID=4785 RepID=UPI00355A61BB|nr:Laminin subunit alpha-1-like [Phytophthora cinnamomi]
MERLGLRTRGGGLGRVGSAAASETSAAPAAKGKFKLRASKGPLPLLTKKDSSRESKPRPKFLKSAGAHASTEKAKNTKPGILPANSFARPPAAKDSLKTRAGGFSFMKFRPKTGEAPKVAGDAKSAPPAFAAAKPFLGKFSVGGLNKKSTKPAKSGATVGRTGNESLFKPQAHVKGSLSFAFRADTKSSAAKKRKTAEAVAHEDKTYAFPCKSIRTEGVGGLMAKNSARSSKEMDTGKQPLSCDVTGEKAPQIGFAAKPSMMANDGAAMKKRGLVLNAAETGPVPKRSKRGPPQVAPVHQRKIGTANNVAKGRDESENSDTPNTSGDPGLSSREPPVVELEQEPPQSAAETESLPLTAMPPSSPDCREESISRIEEELALRLVCTLDDEKEDDFLSRAAVIQDFTDRVGLEHKQIRNRLLDAHADVSENLLDALTDLMAEEGGIGLDKLIFDMNLDVDVDDAFLQDPELQIFQ